MLFRSPASVQDALAHGYIKPVAVLSGNRNFPGRIHPDLDLGFLMSPPLVVAFALAGNAGLDLGRDPVQFDADGRPVHLRDLWPDAAEVDALLATALRPDDFPQAFARASLNPAWHGLDVPDTPRFPWDPASTALRRPPFASLAEGSQLGHYIAYPLMVVGDDITTDHISPASAIPKDSFVADYLVGCGDDRDDLNVFASRRGNWEVMMRAAFYSKSLRNLLWPHAPVGQTLHVPTGAVAPIFDIARRYRDDGEAVVLLAGERYGTGSSRDWAAKGQRLLGIRAVLAQSFERIHRSNLIGMGILPLRMPPECAPEGLRIAVGDRIEIDAPADAIAARAAVTVRVHRLGGTVEAYTAVAAIETRLEADLLRQGGVIPYILQQTIHQPRP